MVMIGAALASTLAVAPFTDATGDPELAPLGKGLADMVLTDLCSSAEVTCVERQQLAVLLDEIALGETGFLAPESAQKLGRGVGAEYVVFGSLVAQAETLRLNVRLVRVETAEVVVTLGRSGPKDQAFALEALVVSELAEALSVAQPAPRPSPSTASIVAYGQALQAEDAGRSGIAKVLLASAAKRDPSMVWAAERLAAIEQHVDTARSESSRWFGSEAVALLERVESGDQAACAGLEKRVWAAVQPLTMGGRLLTLEPDVALGRWKQAGIADRPRDLDAMALQVGENLYQLHAFAQIVLSKKLRPGLCGGTSPDELMLGAMVLALGAARESAGREVELVMIAPDGTPTPPAAMDDLLLDAIDQYVTRFPAGGYVPTIGVWLEPAITRTSAR